MMDKVVCYYGSWATFRPGDGSCSIDHIDPKLCTHLIYAFIGFDNSGKIRCTDTESQLLPQMVFLKRSNPRLKVMISIGGWSEKSRKFSDVVGNIEKRTRFIKSTVKFLDRFDLDGVDLDWEYPCLRGGRNVDYENFAILLEEFRNHIEFRSKRYLLTAAVGATNDKIRKSYDVAALNHHLDFVNVMSYDYNGPWEGTMSTGHNAPIHSVKSSISCWLDAGLQQHKLILGVPAYGHVFQLASCKNTVVGAPFIGLGNEGPYTREAGIIGYNETCEYIKDGGWIVEYDLNAQVPYMHQGDQWISFDNPRSIQTKVAAAKDRALGGIMVWSCDMDDFRSTFGECHAIQMAIKAAMESGTEDIKIHDRKIATITQTSCC